MASLGGFSAGIVLKEEERDGPQVAIEHLLYWRTRLHSDEVPAHVSLGPVSASTIPVMLTCC